MALRYEATGDTWRIRTCGLLELSRERGLLREFEATVFWVPADIVQARISAYCVLGAPSFASSKLSSAASLWHWPPKNADQMFELLKKLDVRKWGRVVRWVLWRRRLLNHIADAPEVKDLSYPFVLLVMSAVLACWSVTFCAQAIGLRMTPDGDSTAQTTAESLVELGKKTLDAAFSVKDLHPDSWLMALLLPVGLVLVAAFALAWSARVVGKAKKVEPPSYSAWWLGISGYLCVLVVVSAVVGSLYATAITLFPHARLVRQADTWSFLLVIVVSMTVPWVQGMRRTNGVKDVNFNWEFIASIPILVVLAAELWVLPAWARAHAPSIYARSLSPFPCDLSKKTCTLALTLSDSGTFELADRVSLTLEMQSRDKSGQLATASLRATWLGDGRDEGFPVQLHADHLRYIRLRLEKPREGASCPPKAFMSLSEPPLVTSAWLLIDGLVIGGKGRTRSIPMIQSQIEKPVPTGWAQAALAVCSAAASAAQQAASPASAPVASAASTSKHADAAVSR